jgi:Icc-related predicted phosphoesterase
MKIIALSDTHYTNSQLRKLEVPSGDVLVHAGDMTFTGKHTEHSAFRHWWYKLPHKYKLIMPGNHDFNFQFPHSIANDIEGVKFGRMPLSLPFNDWAFMQPDSIIWDALTAMGRVDVLITHSPPYGILDTDSPAADGTRRLGSFALRDWLDNNDLKPRILICGHIHESHGYQRHNGVDCYNVAICDGQYKLTNPITVIDI